MSIRRCHAPTAALPHAHPCLPAQAKASGAGKAVKNLPKGAGKGGSKSTGR